MDTSRPQLTQNLRHRRAKLTALVAAALAYLAARAAHSPTGKLVALVALACLGLAVVAELVQGVRGEQISGPARRRFLIVSLALLALIVVHADTALPHRHIVEAGLGLVVAFCGWEVVVRLRGKLAAPHAADFVYFSIAAPATAETKQQFERYLERAGGRFIVLAYDNPQTGQVVAKFLLAVERSRADAARAYVQQTFGERQTIVRELTELSPAEQLIVERWAAADGVAAAECQLEYARELPELADAAAYQLRFRRQPGAGLLSLAQGEAVLDTTLPDMKAIALLPEVRAAMLVLDLAELDAGAKRDLTRQMRDQLDDGSGSSRQLGLSASFLSRTLAFLIRNTLFLGVPFLFSLARGFAEWLRTGQVGRRGARRPLLRGAEQPAVQLSEHEREVRGFMKAKADGRLFSGAAYALVLPADLPRELADDEGERALRAQRVEQAAAALAEAVETASADARTGGALEATRLEDPRRVLTGQLPRRIDTRFLLSSSEAASLVRPLDRNAAALFELDHQPVPNLGRDKRLARPAEGLITLGIAAPGTTEQAPVSIAPRDANGTWVITGDTRTGKTNALASYVADAIIAGTPTIVLDPANLTDEVLKHIAARAPQLLEGDRVTVVDWRDLDHAVYCNPMIPTSRAEIPTAVAETMQFVMGIIGDLASQAPRAIGYLEAIVPPLVKLNWTQIEHAQAARRPLDEIAHASLISIHTLFSEGHEFELWGVVSRYGNPWQREKLRRYLEMDPKKRKDELVVVLNRLERVFNDDQIARIVGSPRNAVEFASTVRAGSAVFHKLPLPRDDTDKVPASLMGLLYLRVCHAAWTVYEEHQRRGEKPPYFWLVVDEAHNVAATAKDDMKRAFRELAKTGVCQVLATQTPRQFRDRGDAELLGEMWQSMNFTTFRMKDGADELARKALDETGKLVAGETIQGIEPYYSLNKLSVNQPDGSRATVGPFALAAPPPPPDPTAQQRQLIQQAQARGAAATGRSADEADEQIDPQHGIEQLIGELELIHGAGVLNLEIGELPAKKAGAAAAGAAAAQTTPSMPPTPSAKPQPAPAASPAIVGDDLDEIE